MLGGLCAVPAWPICPCRAWASTLAHGLTRHGMPVDGSGTSTAQLPIYFPYNFLIFPIFFSYFFFHILSYFYHIFSNIFRIFPKFSSRLSYLHSFFNFILFFPQFSIFYGPRARPATVAVP